MSNLKSLTEFKKENQNLSSLEMSNVQGGLAEATFDCENRSTQAEWNCADSESRTKRDGGVWSAWVVTTIEQADGSWSSEYGMPC